MKVFGIANPDQSVEMKIVFYFDFDFVASVGFLPEKRVVPRENHGVAAAWREKEKEAMKPNKIFAIEPSKKRSGVQIMELDERTALDRWLNIVDLFI